MSTMDPNGSPLSVQRLPAATSRSRRETQTIYQLKVTLQEIEPPIWRRFQVPADYSLRDLHEVLQTVMGWTDSHLHSFQVKGVEYGEPDPDYLEDLPMRNDARTKLRTALTRLGQTMVYEYDFGDCWLHDILLEGLLLPEEELFYPRCLAGARACPPEDCGGVPGYEDLLAIIRDPEHEEYDEMWQWLGGEFDPEAFDLDTVNEALRVFAEATKR